MKSKKEIINNVIDAVRVKSINEFALKLGYSNSSGVYNMLNENSGINLGFTFVSKIMDAFPMVNIDYLNQKSDVILKSDYNEENSKPLAELEDDYDMSVIILMKLLKEQKKTNELLSSLLEK
tara:strand:+ start:567 stop:932 length:366 start_codon:yes stop_codon:yes gene_type:complete